VSPDPVGIANVGDGVTQTIATVTRLVTAVATTTTGTAAGPGFTDSSGYDFTLTHKALTADLAPSFAAAIDDRIQVASQLLKITAIVSPTEFDVDTPFSYTGTQVGTISRVYVTGKKSVASVAETVTTTSSDAIKIMPLNAGSNTASALLAIVNNTAGVKDLVSAELAPGSSGVGAVATSTELELANGNSTVALQNGESFVYASANASPAITLKVASDLTPEIGEKVRLVPMTPMNVRDHFNRKQISGLSIAANVNLVNMARHVQISSKVSGGSGQVFAVGGKASGNNVMAVRGSAQEVSSSIGVMQLDRAAMDLLNPGHLVQISQTGRAKKSFVGSSPSAVTTAEVQIASPGVGRLILGVPLAAVLSYTHTGSVVWVVRRLSRGRLRFEVFSGTASLPGALRAGDWVLVGNGSSYAGTTPTQFFATANTGYFQIRETDASTYFDVDAAGAEQFVTASSAPFVFMPYHSARIGDQIVIGDASPFSTANKGTFTISGVPALDRVDYTNPTVANQGPTALGSGGTDSIRVLDQGYSTYRRVLAVSPSVTDPTNRAVVIVEPGYDLSLLNEGQGAKVRFPNRLGFGTDPVPGISGYQYWTGLKRRVQRVMDGYEPDPATFPGVRAAGVAIEAREPQIQRVAINIKVKTKEGVALASIADAIKSSVVGFVNSLGLSQDVVLSEIVGLIQATSGVDSVVLVSPSLNTERITINDNAIARTSSTEITLS
jgi:hypothetical protein